VDELLRENAGMAQQEQGLSRPEIGWGVQIMWLVVTETGWWFGTMEFYDVPIILGIS